MRKLLFFALSGAMFLSSCEKDPTPVVPAVEGYYSFATEINAAASRVSGSYFDANDEIGVSAYSDALLSEAVAENVLYAYNGSSFVSDDAIEYTEGESLAFRAVYPYVSGQSTEFSFAVSIDQSVDGAYGVSDLLVAETELTSEAQPTLSFNHKLSQIVISITETNISLTNAVVTINALASADCNLVNNTFVGTGSEAAIVAASNGTNSYKTVVVPQTVAAGTTFAVISAAGTDYPVVLSSDLVIESGVSYTYEGVITAEGEFEFTSTINPWGDGGEINGGDEPGEEPEDPEEPAEGFTADITVSDITTTSAYLSWTVSDESVTYVYGLFSGVAGYDDDSLMAAIISSYQSYGWYTYTGSAYGTFTGLSASTEYTMCIFTVDDSSSTATSGLSKLSFTSADETPASTDDIDTAWLGTWNLACASLSETGTALTVEIVITASSTSGYYDIWGFDLSTGRNDYAMPAAYDATTGGWTVNGENTVGTYSSYTMMYVAYAYLGGSYNANYIITGDYDALSASAISNDAATIACGSSTITDGTAFTVETVRLFAYLNGSYYNFYNDTDNISGISDSDYMQGPFTLAKVSDSTTVGAMTSGAPSVAGPVAFENGQVAVRSALQMSAKATVKSL